MITPQEKVLNNIKFIDLFAGIGGFHLALESYGAECVYANEWDKHAQEVYGKNFGLMPEGDITQVDETTIPDHHILCAGFPCQAFSISGKQRGFEDSRGTLFFDVARIVKAKQPRVVFMENVKQFAAHDGGRTLEVVKSTMEELGYSFFSKVLSAVDFGVPQKRERIYMVCFHSDLNVREFDFPTPFPLEKHVEDFLLDSKEVEDLYVKRSDMVMHDKEDDTYSKKSIRLGTVNKGGQGERIYSTKGIAITLSAYGGGVFSKTGGYWVDGRPRKLHTRECARIMGYPDSYKIHENKNQAYKQFGNSVVVDVLQYIVANIADTYLEAEDTQEALEIRFKEA
ncbi:MAG: DNA cytosine methyltransferase [Eubacteriales bacterium]